MFINCDQAQLRGVFASQLSPLAGLLCWTGSQSQWMEFERDWVSINFKDLLLQSLPSLAGWFVAESVWTKLANDTYLPPQSHF